MHRPVLATVLAWTSSSSAQVVFDSDRDTFDQEVFFLACVGKRNLFFVVQDSADNVFGGFTSEAFPLATVPQWVSDSRYFVAVFRCGSSSTPQRFFARETSRERNKALIVWNPRPAESPSLYWFGIGYYPGGFRFSSQTQSNIQDLGGRFGIADHALRVEAKTEFKPKRLVVLQTT